MRGLALTGSLISIVLASTVFGPEDAEKLWAAARKGDAKTVRVLLAGGADVNTRTEYGATALWFAAFKGQTEVVRVLLMHHADMSALDSVWGQTPLDLAVEGGHLEIVKELLRAGAPGADAALQSAVALGRIDLVRAVLDNGKVSEASLSAALLSAPENPVDVAQFLKKAGAKPRAWLKRASDEKSLQPYKGTFESLNGTRFVVRLQDGILVGKPGRGGNYVLQEAGPDRFKPIGYETVSIRFEREREQVVRLVVSQGPVESVYDRVNPSLVGSPQASPSEEPGGKVTSPVNWPSFRGPRASGVADGQMPPLHWDAEKGKNVRWKTAIPGLAHSSPIVWGDRIFLTTAVSGDRNTEFRPGLYGAGTSAKDNTVHSWRLMCLEKPTGKVLWERTAHEGVPKVKRHIKSSHANPTPATDGKHVVAYFASEGLYCFDFQGSLLWHQDVGVIDVGAFNDPDLQWGVASSPVIYRNLVVVQCDRHKDSFIAAYDIDSGKPVWRAARDELPSWGTPTILEGPKQSELITAGTKYVRGYDPMTGAELWRLGKNSEITVPTPIVGEGLIFVTSGYPPIRPVYAVRPGASGDITLKDGEESNDYVAWSKSRGGPYMPTPIVYGGNLYTCSNNGTLACYEARSGRLVYQERVSSGAGYSASPVAADGKLYFANEEGDVRVVRAGPKFELLAVNHMGEPSMATPAISDGMIFIRTQHFLYGIGRAEGEGRPTTGTH